MEGKAPVVASPQDAELHTASLADLATVDDRVGFAPYVQALRRFLTNEQTHGPLTISIEGEWGIGKSSFMKQLVQALRTNDLSKESGKYPIIVWFNAWRHDRAEELWASFALEFIRQVTKGLTRWERYEGHAKLFYLRFKWGKGWPDVARAILWIAIGGCVLAGALQGLTWINGQATKWIARIAIAAGTIGAVTKAIGWVAEKIGNPLKIDLNQHAKYPDYEQKTAFLEQFHQDFAKILKAYVGNRRVFVFVDDLDRCEIPKAAELMQALNLMLSKAQISLTHPRGWCHDETRRIWSLWDLMERIKADKLVWIGTCIQAYYGGAAATLIPGALVTEADKLQFVHEFGLVLHTCEQAELCKAAAVIEAALHDYGLPSGQTNEHLKQAVAHINDTFNLELRGKVFLQIESDRQSYIKTWEEFLADPLFGPVVAANFSTAMPDAWEAALCFATDRDTACVFHCMRVAEKGLIALAHVLNVPFSVPFEYENWHNIIEPVEKAIRALEQELPKGPVKADTLKFYSQAATQFFYFKNAWRNHVAHSRDTYNGEQARLIITHVGDFMRYLADGGLQE